MFAARARTIIRLPASSTLCLHSKALQRRLLTTGKEPAKEATKDAQKVVKEVHKKEAPKEDSWWTSPTWWGHFGAIAGWAMSGSAIYDSMSTGPEVISLNMTSVLIVYSSLFVRWALVVNPWNPLLASCHTANVIAQLNQVKRSLEYKMENGKRDEVEDFATKAAVGVVGGAACMVAAPSVRSKLVAANLGMITTVAAADAGPFTVHFWAPMSKWLISGASFLEFDRPTEKISIAQYSALTLTGAVFSRYAVLVTPPNPTLCAVNIALFGSSAWHLGRKINADFIEKKED